MPAAAAGWVATLAVGTFSSLAGTAAVYGAVFAATYGAVVLGASWALGRVSQALTGRPKGLGSASSRQWTIKATTAPRAIIYGEVTCGGVLAFEHTTGMHNELLDYVIVVAGHQCEAITDIWFDDVKVTNSQINGGAAGGGAVTAGEFGPRDGDTIAWIYKYLGTSAQAASPQLSASDENGYGISGTWTTDHRLRGCAYVHIRLRRNRVWETQGVPSGFMFRVKGARVYDPRLDSTNGGSGAHRLADARTWAYSNNSALCAADYIAGGTLVNDVATPMRLRGFGVTAPATGINWPSVIAAANICDEDVLIPPASPATTQNRYECDVLVAPSDDTPDADCLDALLSSMLGQVTFTKGQYTVHAGAYQTPVYTLTETDLAGPITYVTGQGRSERYNYVRGTRYDSDTGQETEFLPRTTPAYVTDDGATLYHDIELPATQNEYRAQRIAQTILRRSREQQTITWPGQLSAAKIAVWATCRITVAELGITNKVFRCIGRKRRSGANGEPIIELSLREENSATYTDPPVADYGDVSVAPNPGPVTMTTLPPIGLAATSLQGAIEFSITPDPRASTAVVFELFEYVAATPFSAATRIWAGGTTRALVPKADTTTRYYWVRSRDNDIVSSTYPSVNGLAAVALKQPPPDADNTLKQRICPDAEFEFGDVTTYWVPENATYQTGGLYAGLARLTAVGPTQDASIRSRRTVPLTGTRMIQINLRYRVQTALTGSNKRMRIAVYQDYKSGVPNPVVSDSVFLDISAAAVGTWYDHSTTLTYSALNETRAVYCTAGVRLMYTDITAGAVDIDYLSAEIV